MNELIVGKPDVPRHCGLDPQSPFKEMPRQARHDGYWQQLIRKGLYERVNYW